MNPAVLCALMATVAVDFGYEPMPGDGIRYIFRIEPEMIDLLERGQPLRSTIPPEVRGRIHQFQIVSNYDGLSQEVPPRTEKPAPEVPPTGAPAPVDVPPAQPSPKPETSFDPPNLLPPQGKDEVVPAAATESQPSLDGPSGQLNRRPAEQEADTSKTESSFLLILATLLAAGSSSGMLYFGWLAFDYRSRYLGLLRDTVDADTSRHPGPREDESPMDAGGVPDSSGGSRVASPSDPGPDATPVDQSAWSPLDQQPDAAVDDWLNEDLDQERRSRRKRKKSR